MFSLIRGGPFFRATQISWIVELQTVFSQSGEAADITNKRQVTMSLAGGALCHGS